MKKLLLTLLVSTTLLPINAQQYVRVSGTDSAELTFPVGDIEKITYSNDDQSDERKEGDPSGLYKDVVVLHMKDGSHHRFICGDVYMDFYHYGTYRWPFPTEAAYEAFQTYFPNNVTPPDWKQIEALWREWIHTEEALQMNLKSECTINKTEQTIAYELHHIPEEFYTWLTKRETVIDVWREIVEISKTEISPGDSIETVEPQYVNDVDPSWSIPNNRYVRFTPQLATINPSVKYRSSEVIPGVHYKLQIIFAPETIYESKLPTVVNINAFPMYGDDGQELAHNLTVSGTEVTIFEADNIDTTNGLDLSIETRVSNSQLRSNTYSRTMRIAEIRLIPME